MKPLNAIAETIVKLREEAENHQRQADFSLACIAANEATIAELEPLAEWEPIAELPVVIEEIPTPTE